MHFCVLIFYESFVKNEFKIKSESSGQRLLTMQ